MDDDLFDSSCADLEREELQAPGGVAPVQVYAQLLAIYLYKHDLCNAKFLWKRIPAQVKSSNNELSLIWKVGQCMWKRDYPGIYVTLQENWSDTVSPIMSALRTKTQKRAVDLISIAYSSILLSDFAAMAGVSKEDAAALSVQRGWVIDSETEMVMPARPVPSNEDNPSSEKQLYKLTEYVTFLEN